MYSSIQITLKHAFVSKGTYISIIGMAVAILLSSFESILAASRGEGLLANGYHATLIIEALKSDTIILVLPILCTLPYTTSFVDDMKSGFIKSYLIRTDVKSYIKGKIIACGLSGGLVLFIGIIIAYLLSMLIFTPMEAALKEGETAQPYFAQILSSAFLFFVSGVFWALTGMTFATYTNSRYMAYASPFIIYYVLIILYERYFKTLYVLYPKEWLNPGKFWVMGNLGVMLLLVELIAIVSLLFAVGAKRRIANV